MTTARIRIFWVWMCKENIRWEIESEAGEQSSTCTLARHIESRNEPSMSSHHFTSKYIESKVHGVNLPSGVPISCTQDTSQRNFKNFFMCVLICAGSRRSQKTGGGLIFSEWNWAQRFALHYRRPDRPSRHLTVLFPDADPGFDLGVRLFPWARAQRCTRVVVDPKFFTTFSNHPVQFSWVHCWGNAFLFLLTFSCVHVLFLSFATL